MIPAIPPWKLSANQCTRSKPMLRSARIPIPIVAARYFTEDPLS